ncbi:MAG: hypothetical protein Tsb0021_08380 [Chlamydiales bacterium]
MKVSLNIFKKFMHIPNQYNESRRRNEERVNLLRSSLSSEYGQNKVIDNKVEIIHNKSVKNLQNCKICFTSVKEFWNFVEKNSDYKFPTKEMWSKESIDIIENFISASLNKLSVNEIYSVLIENESYLKWIDGNEDLPALKLKYDEKIKKEGDLSRKEFYIKHCKSNLIFTLSIKPVSEVISISQLVEKVSEIIREKPDIIKLNPWHVQIEDLKDVLEDNNYVLSKNFKGNAISYERY